MIFGKLRATVLINKYFCIVLCDTAIEGIRPK